MQYSFPEIRNHLLYMTRSVDYRYLYYAVLWHNAVKVGTIDLMSEVSTSTSVCDSIKGYKDAFSKYYGSTY